MHEPADRASADFRRPRRLVWRVAAVLVLAAAAVLPGSARPALDPPPADLPRAERVILLIIDGLRPDEIRPDHMPNVARMVAEGAASLGAQTVRPSLTLPAHASILTGLLPEGHRLLWNRYRPEKGCLKVSTVFDVARRAGASTAFVSGKEKFLNLVCADRVDYFSVSDRGDWSVMQEALRYLHAGRPGLMLIHLPNVDRAGHFAGWKSERQHVVIREADRIVGLLLEALETMALRETTVVILTSDHGGQGRHHTTAGRASTTVPWILWGGGIGPRELPPVSVAATAVTTLRLLGIETPADWANREGARPAAAGH